MHKDKVLVIRTDLREREAEDGEDEVAKVPEGEEHHEEVEDDLHALAGEDDERDHVRHDPDQADRQAAGAVQPVGDAARETKE